MERNHRRDATDDVLVQGAASALNGLGAVLAVNNQLGHHGVKLAANHGTGTHA